VGLSADGPAEEKRFPICCPGPRSILETRAPGALWWLGGSVGSASGPPRDKAADRVAAGNPPDERYRVMHTA
jgi:hypothetical protein